MISVIVTDYKTIQTTCEFLEHVSRSVSPTDGVHYVIVDNYPEGDGRDILRERFKLAREENDASFFWAGFGEICYIPAPGNVGYARGNNLGTEIADRYYQDEYYLICNNDLHFQSVLDLDEILGVFRDKPAVSVLGPRILGLDGKEQNPYRKRSPGYWLFVYPWSRFWPIKSRGDYCRMEKPGECYRAMGCILFLRADRFRECGRFDEHTFMFSEEMILSEKMKRLGYTCYYDNRFCVVHEHAKTIKSTTKAVQVEKWFFDSMFYYCREYRKAPAAVIGLAWINRGLNLAAVAMKEQVKRVLRKVQ